MQWQRIKCLLNNNQNMIGVNYYLRWVKSLFMYKNRRSYVDFRTSDTSKNIYRFPVVSSFSGAFLGFFIGTSFASAVGYYYLINEYQYASNTLLLSIEELQHTTESVIKRVKQVEEIEKTVKKLQDNIVTKDDIQNVRADAKKMFESLNLAQLETNERFSELEMDVAKLSRQARTII